MTLEKHATVCLIESCWQCTWRSSIFVISKGRQFHVLTDSPSHSTRALIATHPDKLISLDTFLNSLPLSSTSRDLIMWLLTLCCCVCTPMLCYQESHPRRTLLPWPKLKLQTHRFEVLTTTLVEDAILLTNSSNPLYCDTSTGMQCFFVPFAWHQIVFLSHPEIWANQKLITAGFVRLGINADVR